MAYCLNFARNDRGHGVSYLQGCLGGTRSYVACVHERNEWVSTYQRCHPPFACPIHGHIHCTSIYTRSQATEPLSSFRSLAALGIITTYAGWQVLHMFAQVAKSAFVQCLNVCRTPQGIRALARFYVVVFIPLFFGPYYADVRVGARSFAFSLFLAIFVSLLPLAACRAAADSSC